MVDEPGPAGSGLAGGEPGIAGQVLAHPILQIALSPGAGELGLEELECHLVDGDQPIPGDGAVAPCVGAGRSSAAPRCRPLERSPAVADHRGDGEVGLNRTILALGR